MGDQTGTHDLENTYRIMQQAMEKMNLLTPDIVVHIGDMVESIARISNYDEYRKNFLQARGIMDQLAAPWFAVAGDHDVVPPVYLPASPDRTREQWFQNLLVQVGLPVREHLYYSIDFSGYHLVFLYSLENLHTDPRWGPIFLNRLSAQQVAWLKQDLAGHPETNGILVFVHQPHWYAWSNWSEVHEILRRHKVLAVVAGHYHYDQDDGYLDGIRYLVTGSTGGVVKSMDKNSGGAQEITLLAIERDELREIKIYDVETDSLLELTPRRSMDRLQALSCMLDNIYGDEAIHEKNGDFFTTTLTGNDVPLTQIGLESISNPIDVPITIQITPLSGIIGTSLWIENGDSTDGTTSLRLAPGARTGWSNYASVGQWYKPAPLWTAGLEPQAGVAEPVKSIGLNIRVSFYDERERWIESSIFFPVQVIK